MNIQVQFGKRIKELRKAKGLSQEALAFNAGLDRSYMTGIENGKRNVSIVNIEKIAIALEVSISDLFKAI